MWPHKEADHQTSSYLQNPGNLANIGNEQPIIPPGRRLPEGNVRELLLEILRYLRRIETKQHIIGEAVGADLTKRPEQKP